MWKGGILKMSNSINVNLLKNENLKTNVLNSNKLFSQAEVAIGEKEKSNTDDAVAVNISRESQLKYENNSVNVKKRGVTSARELWENDTVNYKRDSRKDFYGNYDILESLRLDEPETYDKYMELHNAYCDLRHAYEGCSEQSEEFLEIAKAACKASDVISEWRERRCMSTGRFKNPVTGSFSRVNNLEQIYSDATHDTSFNYYGKNSDGYRSSLWRYNSKFNVLLTTDMLKSLENYGKSSNKKDKEKYDSMMGKIDNAVNEMKRAEKEYEGNFEWLRFGVKFWDDGRVTYHANYKGCKEKDGIMADSADELLEKLMNK